MLAAAAATLRDKRCLRRFIDAAAALLMPALVAAYADVERRYV